MSRSPASRAVRRGDRGQFGAGTQARLGCSRAGLGREMVSRWLWELDSGPKLAERCSSPHPTPPLLWARTSSGPGRQLQSHRCPHSTPGCHAGELCPDRREPRPPRLLGPARSATRLHIRTRSQLPWTHTCQHGGPSSALTRPRGAAAASQGRGVGGPPSRSRSQPALRASVQGRPTSLAAGPGPPLQGQVELKRFPRASERAQVGTAPRAATPGPGDPHPSLPSVGQAGEAAPLEGGRAPTLLTGGQRPRPPRPGSCPCSHPAPRCHRHQSKSREPERCPLSVHGKTPRTRGGHGTGGEWTGTEKRGAGRGHSGRERCGSQLRSPPSPSPNSKHSL